MKPKFLNSVTDWLLVTAALFLFTIEMIAVAGYMPVITGELVEISIFQLWVPLVLGNLCGHFFPLPFFRGEGSVKRYCISLAVGISAYILWYIITPIEQVYLVLDILADHLYAFFIGGYVLGSKFFPRPRHDMES